MPATLQSITRLTETSGDAIKTLEASTAHSLELSQLQINATRSAAQLVDTLAQLSLDTQNEFKKINESIVELHQGLSPQTNWLKAGLFRILEIAMRGKFVSHFTFEMF